MTTLDFDLKFALETQLELAIGRYNLAIRSYSKDVCIWNEIRFKEARQYLYGVADTIKYAGYNVFLKYVDITMYSEIESGTIEKE